MKQTFTVTFDNINANNQIDQQEVQDVLEEFIYDWNRDNDRPEDDEVIVSVSENQPSKD